MKVIVDGMEDLVQVEPQEGETINDFIEEFQGFVNQNNRIMLELSIDGVELMMPFDGEITSKDLSSITQIDVHTCSVSELLEKTLEEVKLHFAKSLEEFEKASEIVYDQKNDEVVELIKSAAERWQYTQKSFDLAVNVAIDKNLGVDILKISEIYSKFNDVVPQLSDALNNKDLMMVKDLIDYQLIDNLKEILSTIDNLSVTIKSK